MKIRRGIVIVLMGLTTLAWPLAPASAAFQTRTAFENFDQKTNQLYNTLGNVLKNTQETNTSITHNLW